MAKEHCVRGNGTSNKTLIIIGYFNYGEENWEKPDITTNMLIMMES